MLLLTLSSGLSSWLSPCQSQHEQYRPASKAFGVRGGARILASPVTKVRHLERTVALVSEDGVRPLRVLVLVRPEPDAVRRRVPERAEVIELGPTLR